MLLSLKVDASNCSRRQLVWLQHWGWKQIVFFVVSLLSSLSVP